LYCNSANSLALPLLHGVEPVSAMRTSRSIVNEQLSLRFDYRTLVLGGTPMASVAERRVAAHPPNFAAWLPLLGLPMAVAVLGTAWPSWVIMWALAFSVYAGLKWLTYCDCATASESTLGRSLAYLALWPGMDASSFFDSLNPVERPRLSEWSFATGKLVFGAILIVVAVQMVNDYPIVAGWVGMTGIAFSLHFGLFHVLSVTWRRAGIDAKPIMNNPILASSVSNYWGKRWNLAFRDLAHTYVFRPNVGKFGIAGATLAVFLVSGLVHDFVISVPARAGFGLPTLYFLIQAVGLLFERTRMGKRIGTGKGLVGRLFCAAVVLGPILLLLHRPFVERVVVPMLTAIGNS
jgi:hypothetical protein